MDLMMQTGKPIGFGLLTCNSMEQAIHRAGGNVGNKGQETAQAVLAMLPLEIQTSASLA
jgi:6,7-dimethyl-8-ribityllumazine synthase